MGPLISFKRFKGPNRKSDKLADGRAGGAATRSRSWSRGEKFESREKITGNDGKNEMENKKAFYVSFLH